VIKIRQTGVQKHWRERETVFQNEPPGLRRLARKRYIDLGKGAGGPGARSLWNQTQVVTDTVGANGYKYVLIKLIKLFRTHTHCI